MWPIFNRIIYNCFERLTLMTFFFKTWWNAWFQINKEVLMQCTRWKTLWENNSFDLSSVIGPWTLCQAVWGTRGLARATAKPQRRETATSQGLPHCPFFFQSKGNLSPQNPTSSTTSWIFLAIYAIKRELKRTGLWKNRDPSFSVHKTFVFILQHIAWGNINQVSKSDSKNIDW